MLHAAGGRGANKSRPFAEKNMSVRVLVRHKGTMPATRSIVEPVTPGTSLPELDRFIAAGGGPLLATAQWGLEREVLRTDADGQAARTPHPFPNEEKQISVDFAETQAELVTQPHSDPDSALAELASLQRRLQRAIGEELLWPLSLPGRWDAPERVQAASFQGRPEWEAQRIYRRNLEQRHGKARQVISGIHYNFSFTADFFSAWKAGSNSTAAEKPLRDAAYFSVMRNFIRHQYLFNALAGVSPPGDERFWQDLLAHTRADLREDASRCRSRISSVRLSPLGYALAPDVERRIGVSFASLGEYRTKIAEAIQPPSSNSAALLAHEREFYSPVRPKPISVVAAGHGGASSKRGERFALLDALDREGVGYLEFRVFDLDPFEPVGISGDALRFFHLLVLACLFLPSPEISPEERELISRRNRWSTLCGLSLRDGRCCPGKDEDAQAGTLFDAMAAIAAHLPLAYTRVAADAREQWTGGRPRPVDRLREALASGRSQLELGLALARQHREALTDEP
jgi:glutamate--cysteine ligase